MTNEPHGVPGRSPDGPTATDQVHWRMTTDGPDPAQRWAQVQQRLHLTDDVCQPHCRSASGLSRPGERRNPLRRRSPGFPPLSTRNPPAFNRLSIRIQYAFPYLEPLKSAI